MLRCKECRCVTENARDWIAKVVEDEENPEEAPEETRDIVCYCPACTEREFERTPRGTYT